MPGRGPKGPSTPLPGGRATLAERSELMNPGAILAKRYEVIRTIGSGGMGDVYQARRLSDGVFVALKVLRLELMKDHESTTRFRREARAAYALKSPYAARIFEVGEAESGQPFICMEYLEGVDLMSEIDTRGALPIHEAVPYVIQACKAMIEAHELGIIHRDLKPPNLFLAIEGRQRVVKVLDFGISKVNSLSDGHVTSTQMSFGSPLYMSPEQIRSTKLVDERSDIWSLGVILYEALTGEPPFMGETPGALAVVISIEAHVPATQRRPELPQVIDEIIGHALRKDPKQRYQSVRDLLKALEDFMAARERIQRQSPQAPAFGDPYADYQTGPSRPGSNGHGYPAQARRTPPMNAQANQAGATNQHADARLWQQQQEHQRPVSFTDEVSNVGYLPTLPVAMGVTNPAGESSDSHPRVQTPAKTMAIPRITLGPATTDPPVSGSPKKDRLGLLLAAFLIPLGALAFGFAIWLYATRSSDEKRGVAKETSASALLPSEVPTTAVAAVTPHVTQVEGSATSTETSATTAASSVSPSASSAKPTKGRRTIPPKNTAAQPPTGQTHTGRVLPMRP